MKQPLENLPGEEWKPIEGMAHYQVSNLGRIASFVLKTPYIKRHVQDKRNYCRISLRPSPAVSVTKYIHLLVAAAFLPPPLPDQEIDHINGNASDNRSTNLRWCSHKENINHAISRRGNWLKGSRKIGPPIFQFLPDNSVIKHPSLALACKALSLPQTASANIGKAAASGRSAYGSKWSRIAPVDLLPESLPPPRAQS